VDATAPLQYLARVAARLAPEEGWLRLATAALEPALAALRSGGGDPAAASLPPVVERALAAVAPRAMAAAEEAVQRARSLRSGRADNAATLGAAARLLATVTSGGGADGGFGEVLGGLVAEGATAWYASLASGSGRQASGAGSAGAPSAPAAGAPPLTAAGLADLMTALATDLADDAEVYGPALACWGVDVPSVTARAFMACLKRDVASFCGAQLPGRGAALSAAPRAAVAAAALHARAARHAPAAADAALRPGGVPSFARVVDAWLVGVEARLIAASGRLLPSGEGSADDPAPGSSSGSRPLLDFFTALCSVSEGGAGLARADPIHAASLERSLAAAVRAHAAGLERLAEGACGGGGGGGGGLPRGQAGGSGGAAAAVARVKAAVRRGSGTGGGPAPPFDPLGAPPRAALAALADLRALGARTADLGATLRCAVPRSWWGAPVSDAGGGGPCLGDAFRGVRVEVEATLARLCAGVGGSAAAALRREVAAALDAETAAAAAAGPGGRGRGRAAASVSASSPPSPAEAAAAAAQRALRGRVRAWAAALAAGVGCPRVARRVGLEAWAALATGLRSRALGGPATPATPQGSLGSAASPLALPPTLAPRAAAALRVLASLEAAFLVECAAGLDGADVPGAAARARRDFGDVLDGAGW